MDRISEVQLEHDRRRDPLVGGLVLVLIGAALLVAQFAPDLGRYVVLVVGLGLLCMFAVRRSFGALVGGSIVTGVGVGIVLATVYTGETAGAAVLLSIGAGFVFIWLVTYLVQMKERHYWPLIPGAILISVGAALGLGGKAADLVAYWPVVLIVIGALLMAGAVLRRERTTAAHN